MKTFSRIKNMVLSGVIAFSAVVSPLAAPIASEAPSLTATAADNDNYARLLQYSLYFYDANMCGDNSSCALNWRSNCHMTDEVKGGFHDAGDHAMFGLPQGFTAATLGWSYYEFKDSFVSTGQDAHLKVITDKFCDFFKASTKLNGGNVSNFLYQKGDGNEDHGYWGPPEQQGSRKMYWTSNGASDIAAEYSAALAANYCNFGKAEDLTYAEALYKFSKQYNQVAVDGPKGFYNSNGCADEQAWAAGWLYLATKNNSYLNDLKSNLPKVGWTHGWNDAHLGAACLYGEITGDWNAANGFMSSKANGSNYMFLDKWGSARLNCSMQMTALIATKHGAANYKDWAKGQMNYILGSNPANTCFVTGFASNSAKNAHHRAASGYTSYSQFNMNGWNPDGDHMSPFCAYGSNAKPLVGALVGGPCDASGSYHDNMADYICNEVAIDYNAGLVGAAAGLYHFYKTGSIDNSINGVTKIYKPSSTPGPDPTTTTKYTPGPQPTTTTTSKTPNPQGDGVYTYSPNQRIKYNQNSDDKMVGWEWAEFGIPATEKVTKVEVSISSNNGSLGKWQGAFGTSTSDAANDYWAMSKDMQETFSGNKGTVTWEVPSDIADIIQYNYGGELKFGTWWIDCQDFNVDSIKVYTNGSGTTPKVTTTKYTPTPITTTTTKTPSKAGEYTYSPNQRVKYNQNSDDKMIGWEWAEFGIPATEKVTKVEVSISSNNGSLGKWQGAFGTSTSDAANDYWAMSKDMQETFSGNKGTVTWEVPSDIADIIQYNYGGELKFGTWWIDCQDFNVDSIKVYTDGSSTTPKVTTTTRQTTTSTRTTTRTTTTVTSPVTQKYETCVVNNATVQVYTPNRELLLSGGHPLFDISGVSLPEMEQGDTVSGTIKYNVVNNKVVSADITVSKFDEEVLYGDANCNGKIQMNDAVLVMQVLANSDLYGEDGTESTHITAKGRKNGDCYIPGTDLTNKDALTIQKYLIHSITVLPAYN